MTDWQQKAKQDLRQYSAQCSALENIRERHIALTLQFSAIKAANTDKTPVQGGGSRMQDNLINNIVERERLALTYQATKKLVRITERGLDGLTEGQRRVLELFYINRQDGALERLMHEMGLEQAQVYRVSHEALRQLTISMYGIVEY